MARPHIEFIQSQSLPWVPADRFGLSGGVKMKVLSEDGETGAASLLILYPPGWTGPAATLGADEEFLVLEGELGVGDDTYAHMSYAHWPAGYPVAERIARRESVVLTFFSGPPGRLAPEAYDPDRLVVHLDAFKTPYTGNFHPEFPPGAGRKVLFTDPHTQETSWLLGTLPLRWAERSEEHDHVEEMYLLSGESHGDRGVMRPGAYFWRPGYIPHGPYGTLTGNLYFFRTKGGPLVTRYVEPKTPFHWWPIYEPELPPHMSEQAAESHSAPKPW
jgi:hypothetical protein